MADKQDMCDTHRCLCETCIALRGTWDTVVDHWVETNSDSAEDIILLKVKNEIQDALVQLHRLHKPELYKQPYEDYADQFLKLCDYRGKPCPYDVAHCRIECEWSECLDSRNTAEVLAEIVWWEKDESAKAVVRAKKAVWAAWQTVHSGHRDELFKTGLLKWEAMTHGMRQSELLGDEQELRDADWVEDEDVGVVCGFGSGVGERTECSGEDCERLRKAALYLNRLCWWGDDDGSRAISTAQKALRTSQWKLQDGVTGAQGTLCDEFMREENPVELVNEEATRKDDLCGQSGVRPYDHDADHEGKFIVCDHCMAHGLTCNEASVCNQCIFREMPCLHRKCADSLHSRDACLNLRCHYVHDDSTPHHNGEARWIILPGNLPVYLIRDRHADYTLEDAEPFGFDTANGALEMKQAETVKELDSMVAAGPETYETIHMTCCCNLECDWRVWCA